MNTNRTVEEQLLIKLDKFRRLERTQKRVITSLSSQLEFYKHRTFELEVITASQKAQERHGLPGIAEDEEVYSGIEVKTLMLEIASLKEQIERLVECLATATNQEERAIVRQLKNNKIEEVTRDSRDFGDSYGVRFA